MAVRPGELRRRPPLRVGGGYVRARAHEEVDAARVASGGGPVKGEAVAVAVVASCINCCRTGAQPQMHSGIATGLQGNRYDTKVESKGDTKLESKRVQTATDKNDAGRMLDRCWTDDGHIH